MNSDETYMSKCIELATKASGQVAPNPMVGAILVHEGRVIGEGFHQQFGKAHAEVNCINSVKDDDRHLIQKATLYVSLEPCAHFGKTPPCADLIIQHKIPHVVIGTIDPFENVHGKGIEKLQQAGIHVEQNILKNDCRELNKRFFTYHEKKRPFILLKWAESKNKKMCDRTAVRTLISQDATNKFVHQWRAEEDAILVGTETALKDDPALTVRHVAGNQPLRIVIDRERRLPPSLQLFHNTPTLLFNYHSNGMITDSCEAIRIEKGSQELLQLLNTLYDRKILSVMVEGGPTLLQSFIDEDLWDECRIITNPSMHIESGINSPILNHAQHVSSRLDTGDLIATYKHVSRIDL